MSEISLKSKYTPSPSVKKEAASKKIKNEMPRAVTGLLVTKNRDFDDYETGSNLVILPRKNISEDVKTAESKSFDMKKALMPLLIGTVAIAGGAFGLSALLRTSAKKILTSKAHEQLPNLALNMNIREETDFATYMMLRNPNAKTIMGALGVFAFSGLTVVAKNFVDGVKEVWTKKQEADIKRDLQENLIDTETKVFAGKLNVERNILSESAIYFSKAFKSEKNKISYTPGVFKSIIRFKGSEQNVEKEKTSENKKDIIKIAVITVGTLAAVILSGRGVAKNLRKMSEDANSYTNKFTENVINKIESTVEAATKDPLSKPDFGSLSKLFELISTKEEVVKETLKKVGANDAEIDDVVKSVLKSRESIYANAPEALGGITEKIQYYCYLNENRGHLYNWILHPENKFTKYLFLALTTVSSVGYLAKQAIEAVKSVAVNKENTKTELELQKKLIEVEIKNYETKKKCAVEPYIEEFDRRKVQGETEENLKMLANNILQEIKNGPPYVYS